MENCGLVGERDLLLEILCPMVCDRKKEAGSGSHGFLVAEFDGKLAAADLRPKKARFRFHPCVSISVDSVHPKSHHPLSPQGSAHHLFWLWDIMPTAIHVLLPLRTATA